MSHILGRTTNHLERLDPALSRPGRMDVWVEFKNASKWQAELLFRNFFPSTDDDDIVEEGDLDGIELPTTPPSPSAESSSSAGISSSFSSMFSTLSMGSRSPAESIVSLPSSMGASIASSGMSASSSGKSPRVPPLDGLKNQAYLPPPVDDEVAECKHSAPPLDGKTLSRLAKEFADAIPDEEFSVAALQGCE